jgi:hypothetical protein
VPSSIAKRVLPAFVHKFQAIAVRIKNVRGVIAGVIIQPRAWRPSIRRAGRHCRCIGRINLRIAVGEEANICGSAFEDAQLKPKTDAHDSGDRKKRINVTLQYLRGINAVPVQVRLSGVPHCRNESAFVF